MKVVARCSEATMFPCLEHQGAPRELEVDHNRNRSRFGRGWLRGFRG